MDAGRLRTQIGTTVILFAFWLMITWSLHYQQVIAGLICCLIVVWFCRDILIFREERPAITISTIIKVIKFVVLHFIAVVEANIQVAKIVLSPKMPISPTVIEFKTQLKNDLCKVILANAITLTPGTLTIDLEDDVYLVHALTKQNALDVVDWDLAVKLMDIEGEE